jgi:hypothetical protein
MSPIQVSQCNFWQWEADYIPILKLKWPKFFMLAKLKKKNSSTNLQAGLKLLNVLAVANLLHLSTCCKSKL